MRRFASAVAAAGLLALGGCSSGSPAPAAPSSTAGGDRLDSLPLGAPAAPTWTPADAEATRLLALDALRAMALDAPPEAWFGNVAPYLTANGQADAYGTDPAAVLFTDVRDATVTSPSPYLAEATVDTDAGPWTVLMVRDGAGRPWKIERWEPAA